MKSTTLPAGKYYIGDPCYAFPNEGEYFEKWDEILGITDFFHKPKGIIDGHIVIAFNTYWGDGEYLDQDFNRYPVDAGLIGAVAAELVEGYGQKEYVKDCMRLVEFKEPVECYANNNGTIVIDSICIETNPVNSEEEVEYYHEEDREDFNDMDR